MKANPLASKRKGQQEIGVPSSVAAPVRGWNTRDTLANMGKEYAITMDNWLPTTGTVDLRPGCSDHSTGLGAAPVKTIMAWRGLASQKLFGVTNLGIYDMTAVGAVGAIVQARTEGYCMYTNFNTSGQSYLIAINGVDDLVYTNGTVWNSIASFAINGGGTLLSNTISNISSFKRSLYFLKTASLSFFYLPIDSINGIVSEFPLGALFTKGGYLMAVGTWTIDGGFGPDDYSVFVTSEGQAAVYKGTDPAFASSWALIGIYDIAPPMGRKCLCRYGGDLLILTRGGVYSLSRILKTTMLSPAASLSDVIGEAFASAAIATGTLKGWEMVDCPELNILICNIPQTEFVSSHQYVMNTKTMAWCRFKGWDGFSMTYLAGTMYMGFLGKSGKIFVPGNDFANSITATAVAAFNYHSPRSRLKEWKLVKANLTIGGRTAVNIALMTDFMQTVDYGTAVFNTAFLSRWDTSQWDIAGWSSEPTGHNEWVTVSAEPSYASAVCLRVIARDATVVWSATDQIYEPGALV